MSLPPHLVAEFALAAYHPREVFEGWVQQAGGVNPQWVRVANDVVCSFMRDVRYVAFRGSDSVWDMLTNVLQMHVDTKYGGVHSGFEASYQLLQSRLPKDGAVWVGHSRGGAFATRAALEHGGECWTYGSPRVLSYRAAQKFSQKVRVSRRYCFFTDLVTQVPLAGYFHVVGRVRLPKGAKWFAHSMRHYLAAVRLL